MEWEGHPAVTMPFDIRDAAGNKIGVTLVAADWRDPGFLTVSVDGEVKELRCTYWRVPFDESKSVKWRDKFTLDLQAHRVTKQKMK